jgi:hypothetical protein
MKKSIAFMTTVSLMVAGAVILMTGTLSARIPGISNGGPPAIVYFRAEPALVLPGQPSTLTWKTNRAAVVTITTVSAQSRMVGLLCEERLGEVGAEGGLNVCPSKTSTYLLTAYGINGEYITQSMIVRVIDPSSANLGIQAR